MTCNQDIFSLTAGHLLMRNDKTVTITHRATNQRAAADAVIRPLQGTSFASEVGLVKTKRDVRKLVDTCKSRCDMYSLHESTPPGEVNDIDAMNCNFSITRPPTLENQHNAMVYKDGGHHGNDNRQADRYTARVSILLDDCGPDVSHSRRRYG